MTVASSQRLPRIAACMLFGVLLAAVLSASCDDWPEHDFSRRTEAPATQEPTASYEARAILDPLPPGVFTNAPAQAGESDDREVHHA